MGERLTDDFMQLFCEKNSDGTKNLRLKGRDLWQRIHKRIDDAGMLKVAIFLKEHPEIVKVDLCYNDIGDDGIEYLVEEYLSSENNLKYLNLASCNITFRGLEKLASACDTLKLTTLRLNGNKFGTEGGKFAAMLLGSSETLQHLDVGDTDQTLGSLMYFMTMIREDTGVNRSLKVFDISRIIPNSEFYQYNPQNLAFAAGEMLKNNSVLIELHVQKCELDGHDVEVLLEGLKFNKTLLLLDLGFNRIGDHGLGLIAKWLRTRPVLLGLNVSGNRIRNFGARALSFGMPYSRIRLLDISMNRLTDVGIKDILDTIKKPYILRVLFIWGNQLGHHSHRLIARMLKSQVLNQDNIDVKLYIVDDVICSAYYPSDHYKHKYYCVMDHGCPVELRIKRNNVDHEYAQPRAKVKFQYYDRLPPIDLSLPLGEDPCAPKVDDFYL